MSARLRHRQIVVLSIDFLLEDEDGAPFPETAHVGPEASMADPPGQFPDQLRVALNGKFYVYPYDHEVFIESPDVVSLVRSYVRHTTALRFDHVAGQTYIIRRPA